MFEVVGWLEILFFLLDSISELRLTYCTTAVSTSIRIYEYIALSFAAHNTTGPVMQGQASSCEDIILYNSLESRYLRLGSSVVKSLLDVFGVECLNLD